MKKITLKPAALLLLVGMLVGISAPALAAEVKLMCQGVDKDSNEAVSDIFTFDETAQTVNGHSVTTRCQGTAGYCYQASISDTQVDYSSFAGGIFVSTTTLDRMTGEFSRLLWKSGSCEPFKKKF